MSVGSATIATTGRALRPAEVKAWDPFVRIFHRRLVVAFVAAWATGGEVRRVHLIAGYSVIGLLVVRVVWGFAGTKHARFAIFVRGPGAIAGYLGDTARLRAACYLGHNPAGGGMIVPYWSCSRSSRPPDS